MRRPLVPVLLLVAVAAMACSGDETLPPPSSPEVAATAEFQVRNDSSHDLTIACVAAEGSPVACEQGPFSAEAGDTVRLGADTVFDGSPVPSLSLAEVSATAIPAGGTTAVEVYTQQPVDNGLWLREIVADSQYGDARYTLVLRDDDLTFPP